MKDLAKKLQKKADAVNRAAQANWKSEQEKKAKEEKHKAHQIRKRSWEQFEESWERNINNAANGGKYTAIVYCLNKYDMPKKSGQWQPSSSMGETVFIGLLPPEVSEETMVGTVKKVFKFLEEKELNPKLEVKNDGVYKHDPDGGMCDHYWTVAITANWKAK